MTQGRQLSLDAMFYVCKCSAHSMAVELISPLDHRGHEVATVVLDSGGQTDGEEITRGLKAGRLQLHTTMEEEEEDVRMSTQHTYVHMYVYVQ